MGANKPNDFTLNDYLGLPSTRPRSQEYQYVFNEIPHDPFCGFMLAKAIQDEPTQFAKEALMDLGEQLYTEYWRLIDTVLTERQRHIMHLLADGYTQVSIAEMDHTSQGAVTKCIFGNTYHSPTGKRSKQGGVKKRLRRAAKNDKKIQDILFAMQYIYDWGKQ
jgi:hypothetical protein